MGTVFKSKAALKEARTAYLFLIPAFVGLTVLTYGPLITVFALSFTKYGLAQKPSFIGIKNFIDLFTLDPYFIDSIKVTSYFTLLAVIGSMIFSLAVAMLLNRKVPARGFFRAVFYLPYILPSVAVYVGWSWLLQGDFGFFNYLLSLAGIKKIHFIADSKFVVPSLAFIAVWLSGNLIII